MREINLTLPLPPTVNHYWITKGRRKFLGKRGREFREKCIALIYSAKVQGFGRQQIELYATLHFPDRRRRDIDNPIKALADALEAARVFEDDSQIVLLHVERGEIVKPDGMVTVRVRGRG